MTYQLQPGTIAFRAVAWLKKQPAGTEVTSSMWGEALDVDGNTLTMCVRQAVEAGIVQKNTRDGLQKPYWFSLGDGVPVERAEEDDDRPEQRVVSAASPEQGAKPAPAPSKAPRRERVGADEPKPEAAHVPFNACRYIDGSVIVVGMEVREDGAIIFTPKQASSLWRLRDAA